MHLQGRNGEEDREAVEWGRGCRSLSVKSLNELEDGCMEGSKGTARPRDGHTVRLTANDA
ncbi:hypothetical protein AGR6A_pb0075 [Agrobacterium sp. NCPPB 925]|nr:hypothetical protein AGR6A_pb0075 [Agrobacterium sp. NCPPB 925]